MDAARHGRHGEAQWCVQQLRDAHPADFLLVAEEVSRLYAEQTALDGARNVAVRAACSVVEGW